MTNEEKIIEYMTYPSFPATFEELKMHVIQNEDDLKVTLNKLLYESKLENIGSKKKPVYTLRERDR